jgi:hypothetical protein
LHPQDRAYSVSQLFDFIEKAQLTFGRWVKQAPYISRCGVMAQIPQALQMAHLPLEEQYAAAELFRGTMVRHSVIVYRNDGPGNTHPISFAKDSWLRYVPIRMSDTICVQERLPAGAEAVLINRTHSYRDVFMAVDPAEKRLFDAVDGISTIDDILKRTVTSPGRSDREVTRNFFERLWWHDQVVFDASQN